MIEVYLRGKNRMVNMERVQVGDKRHDLTITAIAWRRKKDTKGRSKRLFSVSCSCGTDCVIESQRFKDMNKWHCGCLTEGKGTRAFQELHEYTAKGEPFFTAHPRRGATVSIQKRPARPKPKQSTTDTCEGYPVPGDRTVIKYNTMLGIIDMPTRDWRRVGCVALN